MNQHMQNKAWTGRRHVNRGKELSLRFLTKIATKVKNIVDTHDA